MQFSARKTKSKNGWFISMRSVVRKARGQGAAGGGRCVSRPFTTARLISKPSRGQGEARLDNADDDSASSGSGDIEPLSARTNACNKELEMKSSSGNDSSVEVVISRSPARRCWVVLMGGHAAPLPWVDSADASTVASWVKANASGKVKVQIRL
jgi:hypothetical protein